MEKLDLVKLAKNGDVNAFETLMEQHKVYLYNIANSILQNEEDSGDAMAETVIKVYKYLKRLKDDTLFKTWVTRILINESKKILKKRKNHIQIDEIEEQVSSEDTTEKEEIKMEVIDAVNDLKKEQRDIVILFYYNDMKISEIAKIMNIPEGTVKSRMNTAKKELYEKLKDRRI